MGCLIAERDAAGVLALLEQYEQGFLDNGAAADLITIYKGLDLIDPINNRILAGLERACREDGDLEGAEAVASKLASLTSFSNSSPSRHGDDNQVSFSEPYAPEFSFSFDEPEAGHPEESFIDISDIDEPETETVILAEETIEAASGEPEEIEIEIDVDVADDDAAYGTISLEGATIGGEDDDWFDTVEEIFDGIAVAPRSVKFGDDVDMSDAQSHYDLGVAFKEMGLYDEAINEFRQASEDPARKVTCYTLQAACLREKGDVYTAENLLRSLLKPGLSLEDSCSIKYDLALTCEAAGKSGEAVALLAEIDANKPDFRDVHSRLDAAKGDSAINFSDEELDGFELK
jgi:tetratricopeptide (TPR) repeat protein